MEEHTILTLPYFFGYKTEFFSYQNNPRHLDPSYKTDLDLWDCLGSVKLKIANFDGTDLVICSYTREGKPSLISGLIRYRNVNAVYLLKTQPILTL